ncbi:MAG: DUF1822 family protein [Leptolyngbyaceae cyanobacterium SL_7_1]|nr:DUF1822 family protein [Leptolyngbyaceae cyanobacterium SL_7_1]
MTHQPLQTFEQLDWLPLSPDTIELPPDQLDRALQLSRSAELTEGSWQCYVNALALVGFEQWMTERAPDLSLDSQACSIHRPAYATWIDAVSTIQVGEFRVCLKAIGAGAEAGIDLPRAVVELPELAAHFYVLVEVLEEQASVRVAGSIRQDQLLRHSLTPNPDWTYTVDFEQFEPEADQLLLQLRCLDTSAVLLATAAPTTLTANQLQTELMGRLPYLHQSLHQSDRPLWQLLSWDEARVLFTQPTLADWLYTSLRASAVVPAVDAPGGAIEPVAPPSVSGLSQRAMNVGLWLRDQLDDVATELAWVLLPAFTPANSPLRSMIEVVRTVTTELERSGMAIAPDARAAYRDLNWGKLALRLYAMTWALPSEPSSRHSSAEWTLLLLLGAQPNATLPAGVQLRVEDQLHVLVDRVSQAAPDAYLYARVVGNWDEQFWVTLTLPNGITVTLPPFAFSPDAP